MRTGFVAVVAVAALSFQAEGAGAATVLTGFDSGGFRFIQDGTSNTLLLGEETRFSACFAQVTWPAGGPAIVDGTSNTIAFAEFPDGPVLAGRVVPTQPVGGIVDGTSNTIFLGEIGNDVWIGHGAVIMPGVKIGNGAIVGANAVVTKDVADFAIAVGVPARTIRQRFSDDVASRLDALKWWDWGHDKLGETLPDMRALSAEEFVEKYSG
mgnify:CR=1 FL=1